MTDFYYFYTILTKLLCMIIDEFHWKTDHKELYGAIFCAKPEPEAVIIFVHGLGEHIRRYDAWFSKFCKNGYAIVAADHPGHGRSEGLRGHYSNYCEAMSFVEQLFKKAKDRFPYKPLILYGHSMGGNIALNYLLRYEPGIKGLILSAPWIQLKHEPPGIIVKLASLIQLFFPRLQVKSGIKRNQLTNNKEELEQYQKDNLIHGKITIKTFVELHKAAQYALNNAHRLNIPVLLMHGKADPVATYKGSVALKNRSKMIELKLFDNFLHEIHKEIESHKPFMAIQDWLNRVV